MNAIVLDAGAMIGLERDERSLWAVLKAAALDETDVLVPNTVLAQVWRRRGTQARLESRVPALRPHRATLPRP